VRIWLLSPFSPLPSPGAHESRTATLARVLVGKGHQVVWFSMDWDHRSKSRTNESGWIQGFGFEANRPTPDPAAAREGPSLQSFSGGWSAGAPYKLFLVPVPSYTQNISLRRFYSHHVWGRRLVGFAKTAVRTGRISPPDLILASSPPMEAPDAARKLARIYNCSYQLDLTDMWPHTFARVFEGRKGPLALLLKLGFALLLRRVQRQWRSADGVSAISREYLLEVRKTAPQTPTHLCYIGGDAHRRNASLDTIEGSAAKTIRFLYLGAMTDSYDFDTLFAAARMLADEGVDFHMHLAGSGPREETLRQSAGELQLTNHVTFHGFLGEEAMRSLCRQCDVGLNIIRSGLHITMPHKLYDYLCNGLSVINSLPGEAADLLRESGAGTSYCAGDGADLMAAMKSCLADPEKQKTARAAALQLAVEKLDRNVIYPEWAGWICQIKERKR